MSLSLITAYYTSARSSLCFPSAFSSPDACAPCTRPQANTNVHRPAELPERPDLPGDGVWRTAWAQMGQGSTVDMQLGHLAALVCGLGRWPGWRISRNTAGVCKTQENQPVTFRCAPSITRVPLSVLCTVSGCPPPSTTDTPEESFLRGFVSKCLAPCLPACSFEEHGVRSVWDLGSPHCLLGNP